MNAWIKKTFVLLLLSLTPLAGATVEAKIYSSFLARGEKVLLEVKFEGAEPDNIPAFPKMKDVVIEPVGYGPSDMIPGRRIEYRFKYVVSSYTVGQHTIPAAEVMVGGVIQKTAPIPIEVFNPDDLVWNEATSKPESANETVRYASIIKVPKKKIYQNQTVETEIKIYVPRNMVDSIVDWGVPEFERDGLAVWRYEASAARGEVNLLGQSYIAMSYWTTMSALRSGEVTIGPASVRLTYYKIIFDRFTQRMQLEASLAVTEYKFQVAALPDGAPEGFDQAVGKFEIGTAIKQTTVTEGEPLALDIIVSGSGNLDSLRSPKMLDSTDWKVYDATPGQRGEERRELNGIVIFSQFIRPLELKTSIPPFRLVYFDPEEEKYQTVMTEPISITMNPAILGGRGLEVSGPPQALPLPIERMTDILGLINSGNLLMEDDRKFPMQIIQWVFGLVAFLLIVKALWMRYGHLLEKDETKLQMKKDFQKVLNAEGQDGLEFLRNAGGFVEKWLASRSDAEVSEIIQERDRLCFQKDKQQAELTVKRRQQMLRALRRAAFSLLLFALIIPEARAEDVIEKASKAYESAKYEEAAKLWLEAGEYSQLSADTLYNIGNAAYRMGSPGDAALYYRRALTRDASHAEARQNLRFIERKFGSITVARPPYQYALARFSLDVWRGGLWLGSWILLISILIFLATRPGNRARVCAVVGLIMAPLFISFAALGCYYYPNDAQFAPLAKQAVIVGDKVALHTDASRTSPEVIDAPPGSLAEIIYESGNWAYVAFASQTRGWVPIESVKKIIPDQNPELPKVRKSTADITSA
jgi:tetratricopeptide (TPR) repeat protein